MQILSVKRVKICILHFIRINLILLLFYQWVKYTPLYKEYKIMRFEEKVKLILLLFYERVKSTFSTL